jgi:hypothetical protein
MRACISSAGDDHGALIAPHKIARETGDLFAELSPTSHKKCDVGLSLLQMLARHFFILASELVVASASCL